MVVDSGVYPGLKATVKVGENELSKTFFSNIYANFLARKKNETRHGVLGANCQPRFANSNRGADTEAQEENASSEQFCPTPYHNSVLPTSVRIIFEGSEVRARRRPRAR